MPDGLLSPMSYTFSPFAVPPFITVLGLLVLGLAVLIRERISAVSVLFLIMIASATVWLAAFSVMYLAADAEVARWWAKAAYIGLPFVAPALYHFTAVELGLSSWKTSLGLLWGTAGAFTALALTTDLLVARVAVYRWGFYPQYGPAGGVYLVWFYGTLLAAFNHYRVAYRRTQSGVARQRIRGIIMAFGIGCLASVDYLPKYGVPIYPFGYLAVMGFLVTAAVTIWRYRLIAFTPAVAAEEILATMHGAVVVTDLDGRIQLANRSASELLEYGEAELKGLAMVAVSDGANRLDVSVIRAGGRIHDRELAWRTKSGRLVDVSVSASVLRDAAGAPQGFVYVAHDITARLRAEAKLHEQTDALHALIQAAPVGILGLDLDGRLTRWNDAAARLFGWAQQDMLGRPLPLLTADHPDLLPVLQREVRAGRIVTGIELSCAGREGLSLTLMLSAAPLRDAQGKTMGIMTVVMDVTAQRQLEAQLQQSQKMEALGRLAGGISHDFNNLLFVIIGHAAHLLHSDRLGSSERESIEQIRQAGVRGSDLTRQLLAFSRRQVVQPTLLNLNTVVEDLAKMLDRVLGEDIELAFVPGRELAPVCADQGQIEQVLMNLCVNARDAMPDGGRLMIETTNYTLDPDTVSTHPPLAPGGYVALVVSDTGTGMPPEIQRRIFEPFFTTKEPGKGTGLGLSTVYGIVAQHGGAIAVESQLGRGTTVRVLFPRAADSAPRRHPETKMLVLHGDETVLLVEDESGVRSLLKRTLEEYGYSVLEAPHGRKAVAMAERHHGPLDLLVTDVVMPHMSGPELAERLLRRRPGLKVIFMSGYVNEEMRTSAVAPDAYLQKPFPPSKLVEEIRRIMTRS